MKKAAVKNGYVSASNLYHIEATDVTMLALYIIQLCGYDFHYLIKAGVVMTQTILSTDVQLHSYAAPAAFLSLSIELPPLIKAMLG